MKRFSNILLIAETGTDYSAALNRATELAKSNQATLTLVDIVDLSPAELQMSVAAVTPAEIRDIIVAEKCAKLEKIISTIAGEKITVKAEVLAGKPFIEIIR